jgi:ribosome maturation factor RimP
MNHNYDIEKISNLIKDILDDMGLRFYDISFNEVSNTLRLFIDRDDGGITVDDCRKVSKIISRKIRESEIITFPYTLEVSSPGIERPLKRPEHYRWAIGKLVQIDMGGKKIKGYLRNIKKNGVVVATDRGENLLPYASIIKAKVVEDLEYGKPR